MSKELQAAGSRQKVASGERRLKMSIRIVGSELAKIAAQRVLGHSAEWLGSQGSGAECWETEAHSRPHLLQAA